MNAQLRSLYETSIKHTYERAKNEQELQVATKAELNERIEQLKISFAQFEKHHLAVIGENTNKKQPDIQAEIKLYIDIEIKVKATAIFRERAAMLATTQAPDVARNKILEDKCAELERQITQTQADHQEQTAKSAEEIQTLTDKVNYFEGKQKALDARAEDNDQNDALIKERLDELKDKFSKLTEQQKKTDSLRDELNQKSNELNNLRDELNQQSNELSQRAENTQQADSSRGAGSSVNLTTTTPKTPEEQQAEIIQTSRMPRFDGSFSTWADWIAQYDEQIHGNAEIESNIKIEILSLLQAGAAKDRINYCRSKNMQYEQIYKHLSAMYTDKYVFLLANLEKIQEYKPPQNLDAENVRSLPRIIDNTHKKMRSADMDEKMIERIAAAGYDCSADNPRISLRIRGKNR